ncbi:MAG: hypothetical protein FWE05_02675 [Defluviitaleaceae bacterium]|nr:hypothetical protein [Defluviitaleaceae bacterium]
MNNFNKFDGENVMHFLSSFPKERYPRLSILVYCFYVSFSALIGTGIRNGIEFFYTRFLWVMHFFWIVPLIFWFWGIYLIVILSFEGEMSMKLYYRFSISALSVIFIPFFSLFILIITEFRNIHLTIFFLSTCAILLYFILKLAKKFVSNQILKTIKEREKPKEKIKSTTKWDISIVLFITIVPRWVVDNFVPNNVGFGLPTGAILIIYSVSLFFIILPCIMLYLLSKHKLTFLKIRC